MRVIVLADQRDALLSGLMRLGCTEVAEPVDELTDEEWTALLRRDTSALSQVKAESMEVANALAALRKYAPVKGSLFRARDTISEAEFFAPERMEDALKNARAINSCVAAIAQTETTANRLEAEKAALLPWVTAELPLETTSTEHVELQLGTLPISSPADTVRGELARSAELAELVSIGEDKRQQYVLLLCHKSQWSEAQEALKPYTFNAVHFKGLTGTPAENIAAVEARMAENAEERRRQEEAIVALASCRSELEVITDRLNQDASREKARERSLTDGTMSYLEGWAAAPKLDKVTALLDSCGAAYSFADPQEGDDVPTLLSNPRWIWPINMVSEMYAAPAYDSIDPNPLIFGWYIFFFGFMFADVAYGLIIFLISELFIRKTRPKGYLFYLGRYLGLSAAFCGFFTGGFFGDAITTVSETFLNIPSEQLPGWLQTFCNGIVVNPVEDPLKVLIIALCIGFVQLVVGQCIHIYMEARDGRLLNGLLDVVPWWIFLAGIPVLLLANSSVVILLGVISLVCTQGRHNKGIFGKVFGGITSLYDVTSWLSDVLSYSRLMALMLSSAVIAMVFNTLAAMPKILPLFIVIFALGHSFNIGVNLIGTYVHAARLQYLEFYGKFYQTGGRFFKPLKYNTKFVDINEEETSC